MKVKEMISKVTNKASVAAGKTGLKIKKYSPEILLGLGLVSFVGTVVAASSATLKINDILEEQKGELVKIHEYIEENGGPTDEYPEEEIKRDKLIIYSRMAVETARVYAPAVGLGIISVTCILTSRNILQKRYLAAVCAYNSVREAFETYRNRVKDEYGADLDKHFRYGTSFDKVKVNATDENGKTKKITEIQENVNLTPGVCAVFFDESNKNWSENNTFNKFFLNAQQTVATNILNSRGYIMLNEVYEMLGFPPTPEGAIVGWVKGLGDDYVDFGLYAPSEGNKAFINGRENIVLLDFNHDGIVFDKL